MKKLIAFVLLITCCVLCFSACDSSEQENAAAPEPSKIEIPIEWKHSDTKHWHLPRGDEENTDVVGVVYGYGDHVDDDSDHICDVCGYAGVE